MVASLKTDSATTARVLEAAETSARNAFACAFSTADEYDTALITERRAAGRYAPPRNWSTLALCGCVLVLAAIWFSLR